MVEALRVEIIEVKFHPSLSKICHLAKNLYNRANFLVKESLQKNGKVLFYNELNSLLMNESCYKYLPAQTAQQTIKLLTRNWRSYFASKKEWKKYPNKFYSTPQNPNYKAKNGEIVAIFTNQQIKLINGWLVLPKKVSFDYKTRLTDANKLREVRIVPRRVGYSIEIVYRKILPRVVRKNKRKGAIDLGMVNIVTFVDNLGSRPIVIKDMGKGIKSITQYYLKKQKQLQEQYEKQQKKRLRSTNRITYGSSYHKIRERWRKKKKDFLHKLTKYLVNLFVERNLHMVIVGYNEKWKQDIHFQKKTSQIFAAIPYLKIIRKLKYKAADEGISIEIIPEDYTSKCSFLDNEFPKKRMRYKGKRIKRGIFCSASGILINADVNAAFNILIKSDPQALPKRSVGGVGGYVMYPHRVSINELNSMK